MTPDDERDGKRIDGLMVSYGEITGVTSRHDERLANHDREIAAIRREHREAVREVMTALARIDENCSSKVESVKQEIRESASEERGSRRAVTVAWIGGGVVLLSSILSTVVALLNGGPG